MSEIPIPPATAAPASGLEDALNEFADAINARCANPRSDNDKWRKAKRRVAAAREAVLLAASPQGSDVGLLEHARHYVLNYPWGGEKRDALLADIDIALAASRTGARS